MSQRFCSSKCHHFFFDLLLTCLDIGCERCTYDAFHPNYLSSNRDSFSGDIPSMTNQIGNFFFRKKHSGTIWTLHLSIDSAHQSYNIAVLMGLFICQVSLRVYSLCLDGPVAIQIMPFLVNLISFIALKWGGQHVSFQNLNLRLTLVLFYGSTKLPSCRECNKRFQMLNTKFASAAVEMLSMFIEVVGNHRVC